MLSIQENVVYTVILDQLNENQRRRKLSILPKRLQKEKRNVQGWKGQQWGYDGEVFLPPATQEDIDEAIKEFLKNGGKIEKLEYDDSVEARSLYISPNVSKTIEK